ncbi:MAG TPA: dipeptidase [Candidatus Baltobacteraceae bacterium]|jgi:acetylornithine deacetylase/succinyl-diaminopimelate desuccinylase-like protein|nr:dipeptidase [Candidatus Baltobacteraceae bacterium]
MSIDAVLKYCDERRDDHLRELASWVAIPSISADPAHAADVRRCCELLVDRLAKSGLQAEVLETRGNPLVYGEWLNAPGKSTVIIYGHYDVQPVDPLELWHSPPFEAQVRDGKIYGRGAVDDKGQVLMHFAAIEAYLRTIGTLPVNVKVIVEGEEEIGSPNFEDALATYRSKFAADLAVISDTAVYAEDTPSLTTSIRGLIHWEIAVHGPAEDLHSGYFGGLICNPIEALTKIIATLKDEDGRVAVPGFYDGVPDLDARTLDELQSLAFDEEKEARALGVVQFAGEAGRLALERQWFRPTLECNGIWGGYSGPGSKTIIPSWARAKISARLVGDQDPQRIKEAVRTHVIQSAPSGVRVEVEAAGDTRAVSTSRDHPAVAAAARAMEQGFGKTPVFIGSGGTIGPVSSFDRILHLPQVLIGVGLPDDRIHAPNEKFTLSQFFRGIKTMCILYEELAKL